MNKKQVYHGTIVPRIIAFLRLSRLPFLVPGLAPFTAGVLLGSLFKGSPGNPGLLAISYFGIVLIMLATYYSNEYFDFKGDKINKEFNKFSGGSRVLAEGLLPRSVGLYSLIVSLMLFGVLFVVYILSYYTSRPLLALLATFGLLLGVFYSAPPFRWAYRGVGELFIGLAYGWLATISGYYVVTGVIDVASTLLSLPAAFTVFSVIVINEVPDYEADNTVSKRNLVVRLGRIRARLLYVASNILALFSSALAGYVLGGIVASIASTIFMTPLIAYTIIRVLDDKIYYDYKGGLEKICAATVLLNAIAPFIVIASLYLASLLV